MQVTRQQISIYTILMFYTTLIFWAVVISAFARLRSLLLSFAEKLDCNLDWNVLGSGMEDGGIVSDYNQGQNSELLLAINDMHKYRYKYMYTYIRILV